MPSKPMTFGLVSTPKKGKTAKIYPVYCPKCGSKMNATEMKYNGIDNGHLVESYICYTCGHKFAVEYEGRTERSHWTYVEE